MCAVCMILYYSTWKIAKVTSINIPIVCTPFLYNTCTADKPAGHLAHSAGVDGRVLPHLLHIQEGGAGQAHRPLPPPRSGAARK